MRQVRADRAEYLRNTDKPLLSMREIETSGAVPARSVNPVVLVLDNLRSAFNVGSIFRSADTAGVSGVLTCGICPKVDNPKLRKTAFSALDSVPSRHYEDALSAISELKASGYTVVVMETTEKSQVYCDFKFPKNVALVVGNELTGVDPRLMELADAIVEIPTFGAKNSLNVASALPIVLFEVLYGSGGVILYDSNDSQHLPTKNKKNVLQPKNHK